MFTRSSFTNFASYIAFALNAAAANKDERTAAITNYKFAKTKEGGSFKGTFEQFQDSARTTHQKEYESAVEERVFMKAVVKGMVDLEEGREFSLHDVKKRLKLK